MKAVVLEGINRISLAERASPPAPGPHEVRIKIHTVGICGSDVHYYTHGRIGPYVVEQPMVLGHEASGTVTAIGSEVRHLSPGDRVCMEPGIPDPLSRAARLGIYNVDPAVTFWATPPVDGCLTEEVIHPATFTYRLPDHVSFAEGAMVEPMAIGLQAATRARIRPGDTVAVIGAGTIGMMTALAALAGGAARAIVSDLSPVKLEIAARYRGVIPCDPAVRSLNDTVREVTEGWGADVVFEASGSDRVFEDIFDAVCPGGALVLVGIPSAPVPLDVAAAQAREARIETVFRYANMYDRALALIASGKIDLKPLIGETFPIDQAASAFARAAEGRPGDIKLQIAVSGAEG
ncbi:NAD(P)-dependent alcohol dehydrogenase [Novosphingobium flavum]|uniref:NAD(P)-dependent alcohol dehydrogenase n=1 Tax=Novosphingobium flavum TaxID=1778672 RepID=A0A7X1FR45_9SPHN|nr:NAD(P)-dependent alcohol dehydrogenase [Novosphingobium flavum]MBC2665436.1 NAD(P)-dependent alcohol dehydrogenase [Novosphingobium flavum]